MNANATVARKALEQVCARGDLELAQEYYAADFVDHVNTLELHGHEGIRRSTDLYRALFDDLQIRVVDQITGLERARQPRAAPPARPGSHAARGAAAAARDARLAA
jgi:hypothetical protein